MNNIIHQIDGSLSTEMYHQLSSLKRFITWKVRTRSKSLINLMDNSSAKAVHYTTNDIEEYTKEIWLTSIHNRCLAGGRTSNHDSIIYEAVQSNSIKLNKTSYIFGNNSNRYMDSRVMDFIHGSANRFQNFSASITGNRNITCQFCHASPDSPEHQLLYCPALDDPYRLHLSQLSKSLSCLIHEIVFNGNPQLHKLIYNRVAFIESVHGIDID